jgi:hypothetical protein
VRARCPWLLARLPPPPPGFARGSGAFRPGRSSADGGIDESPEFLDAALRAAPNCSRSSRITAVSSAIWADKSATCADSAEISASRGSSGGSDSVTSR